VLNYSLFTINKKDVLYEVYKVMIISLSNVIG